MFDNFEKLNFTNMDDVALAKWLRENSRYDYKQHASSMHLKHCLEVAKMLKQAHKLGEIRGRILK